jgi:glycosyltransferase involved in cell wall biosynthesis
VTLINPSIQKGGTIFLQIANQCESRFPSVVFLGVESRARQDVLESYVVGAKNISNIWWVQRQKNMRNIYERTSILLVPSVAFEAAGRVIIEAQMAGIPVLGTDCGGIPETINGGGKIFPIPKSIIKNIGAVPHPEEVSDWVSYIEKLLFNEQYYFSACENAISASKAYSEEIVDKTIIDAIEFR